MKCPKCGKDLIIRDEKVATSPEGSPVYNEYAVCMDCHKKWNLDRIRAKQASAPVRETSNEDSLPPEHLREQREMEMRKNYTAMLSSGREDMDEKNVFDSENEDVFEDSYDDEDDEDDEPSKVPVVILTIIIILALLCAGTLFYCKKTNRPIPFISHAAAVTSTDQPQSHAEMPPNEEA